MSTENCNLHGLGVLVTRPAHQSDRLCELIESAHGRPIRLPTIEIQPPGDPGTAREILQNAAAADLIVFTSSNAVEFAFPLLPDILPDNIAIAAIGQATAKRLEDCGLPPTVVPKTRFDSEALLQLEALQQMKEKEVIIIRGEGGRALLGDTLAQRGAQVNYAEVYRRQAPQRRPAGLINGWSQMVDCITITSREGLDNLLQMLGEMIGDQVRSTPMITVSQRIADHALAVGFRQISVSGNASDSAILESLCHTFAKPRN